MFLQLAFLPLLGHKEAIDTLDIIKGAVGAIYHGCSFMVWYVSY